MKIKSTYWIGKSRLFSYKGMILDIHCCGECSGLFHTIEGKIGEIIKCPLCRKTIKLNMKPAI